MSEEQVAESLVRTEDAPDVVIITGMSGAGRTEAMHVFEDLGYYCVDNIPPSLIMDLVRLNARSAKPSEDEAGASQGGYSSQNAENTQSAQVTQPKPRRLAVVCDARSGDYFGSLVDVIRELEDEGMRCMTLFLDADDEKLVARYKSSRRRHPLCTDGTTIAQGIQRERSLLIQLKDRADCVVDTTDMMPQALRERIRALFEDGNERQGLAVTVYSFGFKHGAPLDADLVIDVRFLPNPFYQPDLRHLTGLDAPVRDFVMLRDTTIEFNKKWHDLLDVVMPGYVAEGKQQLAIGVGCTGGQHRSVALAESTGDYLKSKGYRVSVAHRDLGLAEKRPLTHSDGSTGEAHPASKRF